MSKFNLDEIKAWERSTPSQQQAGRLKACIARIEELEAKVKGLVEAAENLLSRKYDKIDLDTGLTIGEMALEEALDRAIGEEE